MQDYPLHWWQISGDNTAHKRKPIQWIKECQEAFDMLKVMCTSTLVLAFADFTKPFKLHTDASTIGLGAVLYEEQGGKDCRMSVLVTTEIDSVPWLGTF